VPVDIVPAPTISDICTEQQRNNIRGAITFLKTQPDVSAQAQLAPRQMFTAPLPKISDEVLSLGAHG
tara:strand:- start:404 stop:604 length:201 start_codon:yes stop_codon:yes gene_type:complete